MPGITRRAFVCNAFATLAASGAGSYAYARSIEPDWLEVVRVDMPLRRLPDAFAEFTVAHISDLHLGPLVTLARIESAVTTVLALGADVIVITGDIVSRVSAGEPDDRASPVSFARTLRCLCHPGQP